MTENYKSNLRTLRIERIIRAPVERVFKAFLDSDAMAKWNPPHGFTAKIYEHDPKVGGKFKMGFTNFSTGETHNFGGEYLEIVPNKLIRYIDKFDDPTMPNPMDVTIEFTETLAGTKVVITQAGLPDQIPMEFATMGWQESFQLLELLVVPEIKMDA
jgi:uncharacterized protein YndB with AHSA1/START domain